MTRLTRILFVGWQGLPDNKADAYIVCRGGQGVPDDKADAYIVCRVARST